MFTKGFVWALAVLGLLWGNATTGTISGTVTDQTGASLSRVEIVLTCIDNGKVWSVHTDKGGRFSAPNLPLGEYVLGAFSTGFITATGGVQLEAGEKEIVDFTLKSEVPPARQKSPPPVEPSPIKPLASVSPKTVGFAVQVAAYQTRKKAEALQEMLEEEGYPAYILEVEVPGLGRHYRVRVGPFKSAGKTKEVASEVRRRFPQEGPDLWIVPPN
jgi:hypothetical protein